MSLIDNVKFLAKCKSATIAEIEKSLGFGNGTIRRWEKASPTVDKLSMVANYFGVSLDYLVNGGTDVHSALQLSQREEELIRGYRAAPDHIRDAIYIMVEPYSLPESISPGSAS